MKFKITATIPTAQYANIQPEIEVEAPTFEEAQAIALPQIEQIWAMYCESGKELKRRAVPGMATSTSLKTLESTVTGGTAFFDEQKHIYTNERGNKLLSGSEFAEGFSPKFNPDFIVPKMEAKYEVLGQDIKDMWAAKGDASRYLGDAIHKALELYGKYKTVGLALDREKTPDEKKWSHVHDNPLLNPIVGAFYRDHDDELALYEEFIVSNEAMLCGHIDRLLLTGAKSCRVQDFKTNTNIDKKEPPKFLQAPFTDLENTTLNKYWLQLSFYAHILRLAGWTVEGLDIFHFDGVKWNTYSHAPIDISGATIITNAKEWK